MRIVEDWSELMYDELHCLKSSTAKRQFRSSIRRAFGGLCIYCRCRRATTLDHLKPRCRGGSSLRSNLVPSCLQCNHSKGSQDWLTWYQEQDFYNEVAHELIQEWIDNKHLESDTDERIEHRAKVRFNTRKVRSCAHESTCSRKSNSKVIKIQDGNEEWCAEYA